MRRPRLLPDRSTSPTARKRSIRPNLEGLEERILLYSTLGAQWTYGSRITYSFMPDGTSVGGTPSALFQTLNAKFATATWQQQIKAAASLWENVTNVNLALVTDGGQAVGSSGNQQGDTRFGDIRIGAIPLPAGTLAECFVPPPINGGTAAGDILFNSNVNWQINASYDLMTVVAHEFGHALGLGESTVSTAEMYGTYNAIKQVLTSDDTSGIQSLYGLRQYDQFNINGHRNNLYTNATNITSYINGNAQIAIAGLDNTTTTDMEWYTVTVPASTTGTMTVTVQSSNLSSMVPKFLVYNSSLGFVNQASAINTFGATISTTASVTAGQSYYIKVLGSGGPGSIGAYGLLVNFGNQSQSPIAPPKTVVASQPDQGGGTINNDMVAGTGVPNGPTGSGNGSASGLARSWTSIGSLAGWTISSTVSLAPAPVFSPVYTVNPVQTAGSETGPIGAFPDDSGTLPISIPVSLDGGPAAGQSAPAVSSGPSTAVHRPVHHALGSWNSHHKPRFPSRARRPLRVPTILGSVSDPSRAERASHQNHGEGTHALGHRGIAAHR